MRTTSLPETKNFARAVRDNPVYIQHSAYYKNLKPYFDLFGHSRVLVVFNDQLKAHPGAYFESVYRFLGVDSVATPSVSTTNKGGPPRYFMVARCFHFAYRVKIRMLTTPLALIVKHPIISEPTRRIRNWLAEWNPAFDRRDCRKTDPAGLAFVRAGLQEDIRHLEDLLDRDLHYWRD